MTIEEYLYSEAEYIERMLSEEDDLEGGSYLEGKRDAYRELLEKLSSFEHEVTLREFKKFCRTHEQCSRCSVVDMCRFDCPRIWDIEEMERRMRYEEEQRARRKEDGND